MISNPARVLANLRAGITVGSQPQELLTKVQEFRVVRFARLSIDLASQRG